MPTDWLPNCGTQLERAIRALFISKGAATKDDCYVSNESRDRTGLDTGITAILAEQSTTQDSELSGNEKWQVSIQNLYGAVQQEGEPPELNRIEMDKRVGRQELLLRKGEADKLDVSADDITAAGRALAVTDNTPEGDLSAAQNEDMAEFTCLFMRFLGSTRGKPNDEACAWVEKRHYEITACPANVD